MHLLGIKCGHFTCTLNVYRLLKKDQSEIGSYIMNRAKVLQNLEGLNTKLKNLRYQLC